TNDEYVVHRWNNSTSAFDSIGVTTSQQYVDKLLTNEREYCYRIQSIGAYSFDSIISPILNFSQEICAIPIDYTPPCPPTIVVENSDCINLESELSWNNPNDFCADDVVGYKLYSTTNIAHELTLNSTFLSADDTSFFYDDISSIAGCYAITAIDSFTNESVLSNVVCLDNCPTFSLPNVFTPDNNGINDFFIPFPSRSIESVETSIFNRWGRLVFKSTEMDIHWDGKFQDNGMDCTEGTYFYICKASAIRDIGIIDEYYTGSIQLMRVTGAVKSTIGE
ncbi:MAG: gliding motility-associated C-terminal domain-containing protein, partial [Flavobacteriales bacterium]|nr:gliding motility-associated C-terminal domain-containing protein [Flavobacteriales bacterium]